jgi:hypothetical protein
VPFTQSPWGPANSSLPATPLISPEVRAFWPPSRPVSAAGRGAEGGVDRRLAALGGLSLPLAESRAVITPLALEAVLEVSTLRPPSPLQRRRSGSTTPRGPNSSCSPNRRTGSTWSGARTATGSAPTARSRRFGSRRSSCKGNGSSPRRRGRAKTRRRQSPQRPLEWQTRRCHRTTPIWRSTRLRSWLRRRGGPRSGGPNG